MKLVQSRAEFCVLQPYMNIRNIESEQSECLSETLPWESVDAVVRQIIRVWHGLKLKEEVQSQFLEATFP